MVAVLYIHIWDIYQPCYLHHLGLKRAGKVTKVEFMYNIIFIPPPPKKKTLLGPVFPWARNVDS